MHGLLLDICLHSYHCKVSKKGNIRNRYNQLPHLTQDTKWESDKKTPHTRKPRGKPFASR